MYYLSSDLNLKHLLKIAVEGPQLTDVNVDTGRLCVLYPYFKRCTCVKEDNVFCTYESSVSPRHGVQREVLVN